MATTSAAKVHVGLARGLTDAHTTQKQADQIRQRMEFAKQSQAKLKGVAQDLQDAVKKGDIDQVKILTSNFETANKDAEANSKDLAQAMMGLGEGFKDIGISLRELQEFSPEETRVVTDAKEFVEKMEAEVRVAQDEVVTAGQKMTIFGMRDKAVSSATQKVVEKKSDVEAAKKGVKTAEQIAEQMRRQRLESMSLDQSLQQLKVITQQIVEMAKGRIGEIEGNLGAIEAGRVDMVEDLKRYAQEVEQGDVAIAQCKAEVEGLRAQQGEQIENSAEWMTLKGYVEAKINELATIESARNKAFTLSQDGQRFLEMYRVQEQSQRGLLQFHQIWIATLEEGVRQRSTLYESHLGVIRAAADQQAMSMVDKISVETDERLTVDAAQHLGAIRGNALDRLESMPEQLNRLRKVTEGVAKGTADFDERMKKLMDAFHENFGTSKGYDDAQSFAPEKSDANKSVA